MINWFLKNLTDRNPFKLHIVFCNNDTTKSHTHALGVHFAALEDKHFLWDWEIFMRGLHFNIWTVLTTDYLIYLKLRIFSACVLLWHFKNWISKYWRNFRLKCELECINLMVWKKEEKSAFCRVCGRGNLCVAIFIFNSKVRYFDFHFLYSKMQSVKI